MDRLRRIYQGQPVPNAEKTALVYGWSRYICWVAIALPYLSAGLSKLRNGGLEWVSATNMKSMLFEQTLYPRKGEWGLSLNLASAPDFIFVVLGIVALAGELLFVSVLFSHKARRILPGAMILMHIGIIFLQNIVFFDLILLPLVYYDFAAIRKKIGQWIGREPMQVLYDGLCPRCRRIVALLPPVDLFRRLELKDFRTMDLAAYNGRHNLHLKLAELEEKMYVVSREQAWSGFYAYRAMASAVPLLWPVFPLLFIPGVASVGNWVYGCIARNRFNSLMCDSSCETRPPAAIAPVSVSPPGAARHSLYYAIGASGLTMVMLYCWFNRLESYPLTDMHMFSGVNGPMVTYYKVLGYRQSGVVSSVYFEDALDAVSINSRYEPLFELCFGQPNEIETCKKSLAALGAAYNKKVPAGDKLAGYEIQRWTWNFRFHPSDSDYGNLDKRFVYTWAGDETSAPTGEKNISTLVNHRR